MVATAKSAVTRQSILAAARAKFARRGYSGTSVKDIAEGLHVTRANFYYYFRDKQQLFIELGTETYRESLTVIRAFDMMAAQPAIEEVLAWVESYFGYLEHNGAFVARARSATLRMTQVRATVARLHRRSARHAGGVRRGPQYRRRAVDAVARDDGHGDARTQLVSGERRRRFHFTGVRGPKLRRDLLRLTSCDDTA